MNVLFVCVLNSSIQASLHCIGVPAVSCDLCVCARECDGVFVLLHCVTVRMGVCSGIVVCVCVCVSVCMSLTGAMHWHECILPVYVCMVLAYISVVLCVCVCVSVCVSVHV